MDRCVICTLSLIGPFTRPAVASNILPKRSTHIKGVLCGGRGGALQLRNISACQTPGMLMSPPGIKSIIESRISLGSFICESATQCVDEEIQRFIDVGFRPCQNYEVASNHKSVCFRRAQRNPLTCIYYINRSRGRWETPCRCIELCSLR